jgi:hypothetical protein
MSTGSIVRLDGRRDERATLRLPEFSGDRRNVTICAASLKQLVAHPFFGDTPVRGLMRTALDETSNVLVSNNSEHREGAVEDSPVTTN